METSYLVDSSWVLFKTLKIWISALLLSVTDVFWQVWLEIFKAVLIMVKILTLCLNYDYGYWVLLAFGEFDLRVL